MISNNILEAYMGLTKVEQLYLGNSLIWPEEAKGTVINYIGYKKNTSVDLVTWEYPIKSHTFDAKNYSLGYGRIEFEGFITRIPDRAFMHNYYYDYYNYIFSIDIPDGIVSIGEEAFYEQYNLYKITFGKDVAVLGNNLFDECNNLRQVWFANPVAPTFTNIMGYDYDYGYNLSKNGCLYYPSGSDYSSLLAIDYSGNKNSFGNVQWTAYKDTTITVIPYTTDDGLPVKYRENEYSAYTMRCIPTADVMSNNYGSLIFKGHLNDIQPQFFKDSNLLTITLPNNIGGIHSEAFKNCTSLIDIISNSYNVPFIGADAFLNVGMNGTLTYPYGVSYASWFKQGLGQNKWNNAPQLPAPFFVLGDSNDTVGLWIRFRKGDNMYLRTSMSDAEAESPSSTKDSWYDSYGHEIKISDYFSGQFDHYPGATAIRDGELLLTVSGDWDTMYITGTIWNYTIGLYQGRDFYTDTDYKIELNWDKIEYIQMYGYDRYHISDKCTNLRYYITNYTYTTTLPKSFSSEAYTIMEFYAPTGATIQYLPEDADKINQSMAMRNGLNMVSQ